MSFSEEDFDDERPYRDSYSSEPVINVNGPIRMDENGRARIIDPALVDSSEAIEQLQSANRFAQNFVIDFAMEASNNPALMPYKKMLEDKSMLAVDELKGFAVDLHNMRYAMATGNYMSDYYQKQQDSRLDSVVDVFEEYKNSAEFNGVEVTKSEFKQALAAFADNYGIEHRINPAAQREIGPKEN